MKTKYQWKEEAESFVYEYVNATGKRPTLQDFINECKEIGIEKPKEYAEKLYENMEIKNEH